MKLIINETATNNISSFDDIIKIEYNNLEELQNKTKEEIIEEMIENSKIVEMFRISDRIISKIKERC